MSEDVLSRAEEACEKLESKDESVDRHYWQAVAGDLLPQLLAEAKRLEEERDALFEHGQKMIAAGLSTIEEALAIALKMANSRGAWQAKAIEERAKSMYPFDGVFTWTDLPEDDRVDKDCPIVTIWGKTHWRNAAARELEEEIMDEIGRASCRERVSLNV